MDEPKYATLEVFKNAPDSEATVIYIDSDSVAAYDAATGEELLLYLGTTAFITQSIELLGFSYEWA